MDRWLSLAAGSLAGGASRYLVSDLLLRRFGPAFPYGTLAVNTTGCLLAGLIHGWAEGRLPLSPAARLLLLTGFCGAFTTFSALVLETADLWRHGLPGRALLALGANLLLGFAALLAGHALART